MLYGFFELVKWLSLGPGPCEQPGTDSPESSVGAVNDQNKPTLCTGSTGAPCPNPRSFSFGQYPFMRYRGVKTKALHNHSNLYRSFTPRIRQPNQGAELLTSAVKLSRVARMVG